jgi:N-acetylglucosamine kinase-like BadF-type ATPase
MNYKIGVDGGGTKTKCILIDSAGRIVARHASSGCNPSVVGPETAAATLSAALDTLRGQVTTQSGDIPGRTAKDLLNITDTLLCMAGSRGFWQEFAASLTGFGRIVTLNDSLPILELATHGRAGLALHAGTGSFVAARAPDNSVHYAGGLGWRFGDPGSGYDLGSRAIARGLLELQGWATPSRLGPAVREYAKASATADASAVTRCYYLHGDPAHIAAFAPTVLRLAVEGDEAAQSIVRTSTGALLDLAVTVATKLFSVSSLPTVAAGLSGPILTHPFVRETLAARSPMTLGVIADAPIEGVRQMLARL